MTEHDPLCPTRKVRPDLRGTLLVYSLCQCALIARVRDDERERIAAELLAEMSDDREPCCDHDCAMAEDLEAEFYDPDEGSFICAAGHWHSPLIVCGTPALDGARGDRRCPGATP